MAASRTPIAVANGQRRIGEDLATWRRLRRLTAAQVADRAGISRYTVMRLENGAGATMENLLRVARALGVLDQLVGQSTRTRPMWAACGRRRHCLNVSGRADQDQDRDR